MVFKQDGCCQLMLMCYLYGDDVLPMFVGYSNEKVLY